MKALLNIILLQANDHLLFTSDKIYTVLIVVSIIFGAVVLHLIKVDRRLKKIEDKQNAASK